MKEIALSRDKVALVDDEDYDRVLPYRWAAYRSPVKHYETWYAVNVDVGTMHRFILEPQDAQDVDHRDGDGLNNTRENLRVCTHQQNLWNKRKPYRNGRATSHYKGVYYDKVRGQWRAQIRVDGKTKKLGRHETEEAAARAYDAAAAYYFGEFARVNFSDDVTPIPFKESKPKTSKYRGVSLDFTKQGKPRWRVLIYTGESRHHLGWFEDEDAAALAYDLAARRLFGDRAKLNFPDLAA